MSDPGPRRGTTVIEAVLLSAGHGQVWFRVARADLGTDDPDGVARWLAGVSPSDPAGLLHSTSWRFDAGRIVLTYAALPDPDPGVCLRPVPLVTRCASAGPLAPSPESVPMGDVARHACRHLAYLRGTDPLVAARAATAPQLWALIDEFVPAMAGLMCQPTEPDNRLASIAEVKEFASGPVHAA